MANTKKNTKKTDKRTPAKDHVTVRLDLELIARLEALAVLLSRPWRAAKLSDALRAALLKGLPLCEIEHAAEKKGGAR